MPTPSEVADVAELYQLVCRYAAAVDGGDVGAFVEVFHPEGQLSLFVPGATEPVSVRTGYEQLAVTPKALQERFARTVHLVSNHLVELDGDSASGTLLCTARLLQTNPVGGTDLVHIARYIDRYERRQGRWRILDRQVRMLWSESHATLTNEQAASTT